MNEQRMDEIEARVQQLGQRILAEARTSRPRSPPYLRWMDGFMKKLLEDASFRIQALRFIDVLPALKSSADVALHVREYFRDEELPLPPIAKWGIRHADATIGAHAVAAAVRVLMMGIAGRFVGGRDVKQVLRTVLGLRSEGVNFTVDLWGETTVSEAEAEYYAGRYVELIDAMAPQVAKWEEAPLLDTANGRPAPRLNVSIKVSALYSQMNAAAPQKGIDALKVRLRPILQAAQRNGAAVCLDMEHYDDKEIVLGLFRQILMEPEFRDWPDAGVALQAYLRDAERDLAELIDWARARGMPVTVRLVRGAYWDYETVIARQHRWPLPVWSEKAQTDMCYERCLRLLLENHAYVHAAVATHNVRSLALALVLAEKHGLAPDQYEFQMLYGMAESLRRVMTKLGYRMRVYAPFGELIPGMAYLVRRLLENTSNQSFVRMSFVEDLPPAVLLASPRAQEPAAQQDAALKGYAAPLVASGLQPSIPEFTNEPTHRFIDPAERQAFAAAIETVRGQLGREYMLIIGGRDSKASGQIVSLNPARPQEVVGYVAAADEQAAEAAVDAARAAFPAWRDRSARERADLLMQAAARLRAQRDEFAAWEIFEAGKVWREADADVCEAIDFMEYYAREALRLASPQCFNVAGETNAYIYQPRGVGVIIPPWNFPLAILTGMLSAAIVTGNTVILKPSSQTPVMAAHFMQVLREAGLPDGVVNFVPGPGGVVGDYLVRHPQTHFVAFTGSLEVGTRINRMAAEIRPGQQHVKRVIAEMGGKNAIIVDSDADLDDAVRGTAVSAFGYQGQKCSAASRVIVVGDIHDAFMYRLVEATRSLLVGLPEDPGTFIGPVIEETAYRRIRTAIEDAKQVAGVALEGDVSCMREGYFIGPTVFIDVPPESPLAQEEIFGPVLAVMRAGDFTEAVALANNTRYALTGGVYSRNPAHLNQARDEFRVGNLYLNRKITGAVVGRQPFGGFNLSGVGSKAGGPDYLLQFVEPRAITENTLRRGFAPDEDAWQGA